MDLKKLLCNVDAKIYGKVAAVEVRNLTKDSRNIGVGDIFIAHQGKNYDGNDFSLQAVKNGAIAVVSSIYNPFLSVVQVISPDVLRLEADLAAKYYDHPSSKLSVIGVTGTNGKTTVTHIIKQLLDGCGYSTGLIGTIGHVLGVNRIQDGYTTPESSLLQKYLAEIVRNKMTSVAMEVSSIALALGRVKHVEFDVGVLTNVTLDHLDFHGTFTQYLQDKVKLFTALPSNGLAVINRDLDCADLFLEATSATPITYGVNTSSADYLAKDCIFTPFGTEFTLCYQQEVLSCKSPLIGLHNVYNVLAAIAVVHQKLHCDLTALLPIIKELSSPKGRLEPVFSGPCPVYIDYAHTPDALENVCRTLHELVPNKGRLIVVFGCGGDRDRSKRKLMAESVEKYGLAVVTSDNPRGEDPEAIIQDICVGFVKEDFIIKIDRKQAITYALSIASDKDIVLIAGKGHETYQIFKHQTVAFDDKEVVCEAWASCV